LLASAALNRAARIAIPVIVLNGVSGAAFAQDATWVGATSDWNTLGNWNPNVVPTGTATFNPSTPTSITFSAPSTAVTAVQNLAFNAPGYTFNLTSTSLSITGSGIQASLPNAPTFNVSFPALEFTNSSTAGPAILNAFNTGPIAFLGNSNAGNATINAGLAGSTSISDPVGFTGGFVFFRGSSTAADAKITSFWASNIEFQDTSKAGNATITAPKNGGSIFFENASSADHATITMLDGTGELSFAPGFFGGGTATAGNATIINNGRTNFFQDSSAGNATITTNAGGVTSFFGNSTGGNAAFITNAGGILDISGLGTFPDTGAPPVSVPGMTAGSIEGAGSYFLGSETLTVGSNNLNTTVSGTISDGGASGGTGGSLVKVGTGTLTLSGANTYTGLTTISEGAINLTGSLLSPVSVEPSGTLGSTGTVFNTVTNAGTVAPGFGLPAAQFGTLTVTNYVGAGGTLALRTFLGTDGSPSDLLTINGGTATGSTSVRITNVGGPGAETTSNGILVVNAINGATTASNAFMLAPGELRAGAFDYDLFHGGVSGSNPNNWFLRSTFVVEPIPPVQPPVQPPVVVPPEPPILPPEPPPQTLPPGVFPIIGPEIATYGVVQPIARQLGMTTLGTLHDRIGDTLLNANTGTPCPVVGDTGDGIVRKAPAKAPTDCLNTGWGPSVWGRVLGQQIDNHYGAFADPRASGQLLGFQSGIDLWRGEWLPGHRDAAGIYVGFANANVDVSGLVTNEAATGYVLRHTGGLNLDAWSGGAYWTHYGPSDWYLDAVAQATHYQGAASTQFASLATTGFGFLTSLETGFPVRLPMFGPGFVLEPQAQIVWQRVSFDDANDGLGDVALGTTSGASGRIGLRGRWTIVSDSGQVWQPYVRANLWRDWGARATTTYSGVDLVPLLEQANRLQLGGGLSVRMNANVSFYANADYQFAVGDTDGGRRDGIRGAAGVRYTW
jgi:outer membrane autotransporter protein